MGHNFFLLTCLQSLKHNSERVASRLATKSFALLSTKDSFFKESVQRLKKANCYLI